MTWLCCDNVRCVCNSVTQEEDPHCFSHPGHSNKKKIGVIWSIGTKIASVIQILWLGPKSCNPDCMTWVRGGFKSLKSGLCGITRPVLWNSESHLVPTCIIPPMYHRKKFVGSGPVCMALGDLIQFLWLFLVDLAGVPRSWHYKRTKPASGKHGEGSSAGVACPASSLNHYLNFTPPNAYLRRKPLDRDWYSSLTSWIAVPVLWLSLNTSLLQHMTTRSKHWQDTCPCCAIKPN